MEPRPFDEPGVARRLGMEDIPLSTGTLDDGTIDGILSVLRGAGPRPVFLHCSSGSRAGGALLPYLIVGQRMSEDGAITEAMRIGLRNAEYLNWGVEYVRRGGPG